MNLSHALHIAEEAAFAAGERILEALRHPITSTSKGDIADRVTQTDLDCQRIIQEKLAEEFPEIAFFGEEESEPLNLQTSQPLNSASSRWIVDPLDGTMNFTHRLPFFGVSIALEQDGEIVLGVLHFPVLQWTYTATKGHGAKKNGAKIHVSDCVKFEDAVIAEIYSDREARGKKALYPPSAAYRKFGSAITSIALLAEGAVDGVVLRCRKWDIAAGEVIVREAGGSVSIDLDDSKNARSSLTCVAAAPAIHKDLQSLARSALR